MSDISLGYRQPTSSNTIIYMTPEDIQKVAEKIIFGKFFTGTTEHKYMGDLEIRVKENEGAIMDLTRTPKNERGITVTTKLDLRIRRSHYQQLLEIGETQSREDGWPLQISIFNTSHLNVMTGSTYYEYLLSLVKNSQNGFISRNC